MNKSQVYALSVMVVGFNKRKLQMAAVWQCETRNNLERELFSEIAINFYEPSNLAKNCLVSSFRRTNVMTHRQSDYSKRMH